MNKIISLLFIIFSAATLAQSSCQYTKLSSKTVEKSAVIKDLRDLGAEWVISRAIHHNSQQPWENELSGVANTLSVERRISKGVYYFRYKVQIVATGYDGDTTIDPDDDVLTATYTISFRPSNGKVSITSYRFSIKFSDRLTEVGSDTPFYADPTKENGPSDDDIDVVVGKAIKEGSLRDGKYSLGKVYGIFQAEDSYYYEYLVTLVRTDGYTVRAQIVVDGSESVEGPYRYEYKIYTNRL